jgi:cardiolipin synthase A/B
MGWFFFYLSYAVIGWIIRGVMLTVVLRRQFAPGASVAWLGIVFLHPYIGLILYLLLGESRLGPRRTQRHLDIMARYRNPDLHAERAVHQITPDSPPPYYPMILQAQKISGLPVLAGNRLDFITDSSQFRDRLCADIAAAKQSVNLLYYMFAGDATARAVAGELTRACQRGVKCRLLADGLASRKFFQHSGLSRPLMTAGVEVAAALPVTPIRRRFARMDLRNHRKLAIIDGKIAYAGSQNIINPDYGGRHGAPWIDLSARFTGPIVGELASIFAEDWDFETGKQIEIPYPERQDSPSDGPAGVEFSAQVVPTGPTVPDLTYRRLLLAAIQSAQHQLTLTTPYFVPDEPTILSLMMAADRGVDVKLIMPMVADHFFAAAAGRAHYYSLLRSGIGIHLFQGGLLHTKSATVDDAFALFGSANLDVRSFLLNFELSVLAYGQPITQRLRDIQNIYLSHSHKLELSEWKRRPIISEYADNAVGLLSPLL